MSNLYTDFYNDYDFIEQSERLEKTGILGGKIKTTQVVIKPPAGYFKRIWICRRG